jgi:hypothetical protein
MKEENEKTPPPPKPDPNLSGDDENVRNVSTLSFN